MAASSAAGFISGDSRQWTETINTHVMEKKRQIAVRKKNGSGG